MRLTRFTRLGLSVLGLSIAAGAPAQTASTAPAPPRAATRPHDVVSPHGTRGDEYYWLRDDTRKDPDVLRHLEAENKHTEAVMAPLAGDRRRLFDELVGRLAQDDSTVPFRKDGYWYYTRYEKGKEYPIYARKRGALEAPEEVLLDGNAMAEGHGFFQIGSYEVTPDGNVLAYTVDTVGRRQFTLRFRDLRTGRAIPDEIPNVEPALAWANDNRTLLYIEKDPVTLLGRKVRKHVLLTAPAGDALVYEEKDRSFYLTVERSRSGRFLHIGLGSTVSNEHWVARADDPKLEFRLLVPRERDLEYEAEDRGDHWVILTNWQARNFRIVEAPMATVADRSTWRDVVPHRPDAFLHGARVFRGWLAVAERSGGLRKLRLRRWSDGKESLVIADEAAYTTGFGTNAEQDTSILRYTYTSLTTPSTVFDLDMDTGERALRKRDPVLGGFDPADYATEYLQAEARDGAKVPVSIVYRKDTKARFPAPLYQQGYGAYGLSSDPTFSSSRLSLLDRGVIVAIAHVRGGQELGRAWYEDGKLLKKKNTFTDFIDVTEFLVKAGYADRQRIAAYGGSAGGLLMGAVLNMRPDLYRVVTSRVPFVDAVTTMLDESIPLTTNEFDEWGNPKQKEFYDYILSYSPYDNIRAQDYPAILVTTGLWDSQVQYYEPAKWVARLRAHKTDSNPLLFLVNMEAGHGGKSGRFRRYEETALEYAFVLDRFGIEPYAD